MALTTRPPTIAGAGAPEGGQGPAPLRRARRQLLYRPRPRRWSQWGPAAATVGVVLAVIAITLWQLHLNLLFSNTSTTGGDTGAHYMLPQYIKTALLPHGQLTGWDPAWYDGFPLYTFYFILPDLWAAIVSYVIPYDIAFKWATVLGSLTLPVAAWALGRLFRLRPPVPAVLAAATLSYLFDYTWTIYGGNLFSTLAGEYAYSLSISLALVFLGLFAYGLRTGRYRGWAAVVLALCIAAHIVPAMFALAGAGVLTLFELAPARFRLRDDGFRAFPAWARPLGPQGVRSPGRSLWWAASTVAVGVLLSGWWLVPFGIEQPYANSMGYTNVTTWDALLYPRADWWVLWLAAASALLALATLSRIGIFLSIMGGLSAAALVLDPQGSLYNTRFLPLWFLCAYLLTGWGFAVSVAWLARWWRRHRLNAWSRRRRRGAGDLAGPRPRPARWAPGAVVGPFLALLGAGLVVIPPFLVTDGVLPASWLPVTVQAAQVSGWAQYNYVGYEGQPAYPELEAVRSMMQRIGETDGCGRAMWEYNPDLDRFGTPMALMLLPFWTDGCIDSMEGLLFESSATTAYHFLNQSELSVEPSDPMVGLPYGPLDVPLGIQHLQLLGVRYFMASSPQVQQAARADPSLELLDRIGPFDESYDGVPLKTVWEVFEVKDSQMVTPLRYQPVVWTGVGQGQSSWLSPSVAWYDDPAAWDVERVAAGPSSWARLPAKDSAPKVPVAPTTVSDIRVGNQSLSFHVSRIGTPVLVKVSYFPNWRATGADGPWRATPNLMVVVPTSHEVTLDYDATTANHVGLACTAAGVVLVVVPALWWRFRRRHAAAR